MEDRDPGARRPRRVEVPGLSPVRAFFIVGALAALPLALLVTRSAEPSMSPEPTRRSPSYELTEAEAIAEFERLNAQLMAAYRERNIALAEDVVTSDSPILDRAQREIDVLIDSAVISRTRFVARATHVVSTTPSKVVIEHVEDVYPRFQTESGKTVSGDRHPLRESTTWELYLERGRWLLHDAVVTRRERLD